MEMRPEEHKGNTHVERVLIFIKIPLIFAADGKITNFIAIFINLVRFDISQIFGFIYRICTCRVNVLKF